MACHVTMGLPALRSTYVQIPSVAAVQSQIAVRALQIATTGIFAHLNNVLAPNARAILATAPALVTSATWVSVTQRSRLVVQHR